VRKGITQNHVDLPPLVSIEATGLCIPLGDSEVLLAAAFKSPGHAWNHADVTVLLSFRHKALLAGDPNAKHPFWNSVVSNPSGEKLLNLLLISKFEISAPHLPLIIFLREMVTFSILLCTRMSGCQKSLL
jgi:hypothetical protein